ncbi:Cysteine synthase [bioreactor metagenome]|uniref:Cysteine synthase n=1 Tax=bioreactor metagenome TaxID=1076179 RepID=A0A644XKI9_9ZZZZ|nr:cysteine synthase family protein [Oscillospiraceae bacterium]
MTYTVQKKFSQIKPLIGNTPILKFTYSYKGKIRNIYVKAEQYNLTGSIKDRVAFHILKNAYENGLISPGDIIAEATSGNTGISFSALGSFLGHKVKIFMPDWMSKERVNLMRSFGAEVISVSREQGGFKGSITMCEDLAKSGGVFLPRQFSNEENTHAHFIYTGEEIASQLASIGLIAESFIAGVGTGGTVMGTGLKLREINPKCTIHPLEPMNSPTLSTGFKVGSHRIQGISDDFIPPILHMDKTDSVVSVDDGDSIVMARMISEFFGIGVGISSGANFIGACMVQNLLGDERIVVTVFPDDNKKYLSTDYSEPQTIRGDSIISDIKLLDMTAYK